MKNDSYNDILPGRSWPLGATVMGSGVNFSIFSKHATSVELILFERPGDKKPFRIIKLKPDTNKTFYYWHCFVQGIGTGQIYAWRAYGPFQPEKGLRFDPSKILLDPYAKVVITESYDREAAKKYGEDNCESAMKCVVSDSRGYDWEGDKPLRTPYSRSIIYELHVGGFTKNTNSGLSDEKRGTYAGVIEKIPYLKSLGITAVELLPVQQLDDQNAFHGFKDYWGYSPIGFFAPHNKYSSRQDPLGPIFEFRSMVKALHSAGIEVILDVVFNHTAEIDETGPTLSFRGLGNDNYYILNEKNPAVYSNYSGCGNSINANHSIVRRLISDCLRYWVSEMHVDGFRFDLASALTRDEEGNPMGNPPIIWSIESDPVLAGTKVIAEAWDAAGLYQVGRFIGDRFAEWNGPFRDNVRAFVRGDENTVKNLASRLIASPDIYTSPERQPNRSINFITCHDGFTLNDLVSYNFKHNEENGENNNDGSNDNFSFNCSIEGPSDNPEIEALRIRQIKNFISILLLSQGTPMLLMGDEVRRTQRGNNNCYCQDNELSWFDWRLVEKNKALLRFTSGMIKFTIGLELFRLDKILDTTGLNLRPSIKWHGVSLGNPDWASWSHTLSFELIHKEASEHLFIMLNFFSKDLSFDLPGLSANKKWYRIADTSLSSPDDFCKIEDAPEVTTKKYSMTSSCVSVLLAR
jgi:isoamylase